MDRPKDTYIIVPYTEIKVPHYFRSTEKPRKGVRIYKDTPSTVALQVWGLRANTPMYALAHMNKEALTELRDAASALLAFL